MKISALLRRDAFIPCETRHSLIDWSLVGAATDTGGDDHQRSPTPNRFAADRVNLILWYRDGDSVPFYTVDARPVNEIVGANQQIDPAVLTNPLVRHHRTDERIDFDLSKLTPLLHIRNVTEQDEGLYQCRVEYASARTFATHIRLSVIGLSLSRLFDCVISFHFRTLGAPTELHITDRQGNRLHGVIGPFNEFENITLLCKAYGGENERKEEKIH